MLSFMTIFPFSNDQDIPLDGFFSKDSMPHSGVSDVPTVSSESPASVFTDPVVNRSNTAVLGETSDVMNTHPSREASKRVSKTPGYLNEYLCHVTETDIPYPLAAYVSYAKLSEGYELISVHWLNMSNQHHSNKPRCLMNGLKQ